MFGTTWVSQYQKGKTKMNLDFLEKETGRGSGISWAICKSAHLQICTSPHTDNMLAPHHSVFYRPDALPATQPTASKHWRLEPVSGYYNIYKKTITALKNSSLQQHMHIPIRKQIFIHKNSHYRHLLTTLTPGLSPLMVHVRKIQQ